MLVLQDQINHCTAAVVSLFVGLIQGSVTGSLLYSAGQHPILKEAARRYPTVSIIAIIDDLAFNGPPLDAIAAYQFVKMEMASTRGITYNDSKAQVLWCGKGEPTSAIINACHDAHLPTPAHEAKALGTIITSIQTHYEEHVQAKLISGTANIVSKLQHPAITVQNRLAIIRYCLTSRAGYYARTISPLQIENKLLEFDDIILNAVHDLVLGTPERLQRNDDGANQQIRLPISMGGLGIRNLCNSTSLAAFWSNVAGAAPQIEKERQLRGLAEATTELDTDLKRIHRMLLDLGVKPDSDVAFPTEAQLAEHGFFGYYTHCAKLTGKLQHAIQEQLDEKKLASIFDQWNKAGNRENDIARLRSLQHEDCKLLLTTLPTKKEYSMSDEVCKGFLNRRLGLPEAPVLPERCICGGQHDSDSNSHALRCNRNAGGRTYAHNVVVREFAYCGRKTGHLVDTDKLADSIVMTDEDDSAASSSSAAQTIIPDLELHSSTGTIICDVSLAISQPSDYRSRKSAGTAATAKERESRKMAKYKQLVEQRGSSCTFYPLVIERDTLAIGPKTLELIDTVCAHSRSFIPPAEQLSVLDVKVRLQLAVCRGTTALIRQAFTRDHRAAYRASVRLLRAAAGSAA
jgi:hypothetical protein